jgi:hypothetical protein
VFSPAIAGIEHYRSFRAINTTPWTGIVNHSDTCLFIFRVSLITAASVVPALHTVRDLLL